MPDPDVKQIRRAITKFLPILRESREANKSEAETVMVITKFLEEALGYDVLRGELSREFQIKDKYCDLAVKIDGQVRALIEVKDLATALHEKHTEQAENYASHSGVPWVILTNGIVWHLYHLTFNDPEGINRIRVLLVDLLAEGADAEALASQIAILHRESVAAGALEDFWQKYTAMEPRKLIRALFSQSVLSVIRREVRRETGILISLEEILEALKGLLDKGTLADLADIRIRKRRRRLRKQALPNDGGQPQADDAASSEGKEEEAEEDENKDAEDGDAKTEPHPGGSVTG